MDIEYRLTRSAAARCGEISRPHAGVLLAMPDPTSGREAGSVASDAPTIVYVVPGGSFDRAGLRAGDGLVALDGEPVRSSADVLTLMLSSGTRRSVRVTARRGDAPDLELDVPLEPACPIRLGLATSALLIPWQTQRLLLSIPIGLTHHVDDDATLATVVAHQMAHALYDKPDDDAITAEQRADRIGLEMAAAAGYEILGAPAYWEDVAAEYPVLIGDAPPGWRPLAWTQDQRIDRSGLPHPEIARRLGPLRAAIDEIAGSAPAGP